ncbi:MAG: hypothetical protein V3R99_11270 [Thermoguttaceae bacterium]
MTALDQAFIKAYLQKERASAEPPDSAKPVLSSSATDEQQSPQPTDASAPIAPERLLDALEESSDQGNDSSPRSPPPTDESETPEVETLKIDEAHIVKSDVPAFLRTGTSLKGTDLKGTDLKGTGLAASGESGVRMRRSLGTLDLSDPAHRANSVHRIDPAPTLQPIFAADESSVPAPHLPIESASRASDTTGNTEEATKTEPSDAKMPGTGVLEAETSADTDILPFEDSPETADSEKVEVARAEEASDDGGKADRPFLPMLQVERYTLPKTCLRLDKAAPSALDRLTDGLAAAMARRHRVLAIGACRHGEGATTMLLCAAQRLVRRGLKIVMVDAQFEEPRLAGQLGLAPEFGWEEVLTGRMPLEDVVIEAVDNRLAVLPCCRPLVLVHQSPETESRMAESLRMLRENYDLVLVDMDPLDERTLDAGLSDDAARAENSLVRAIVARLEAVMLVHDVSTTPPHHLGAVQRRLAATGIASAGVVENFVPT